MATVNELIEEIQIGCPEFLDSLDELKGTLHHKTLTKIIKKKSTKTLKKPDKPNVILKKPDKQIVTKKKRCPKGMYRSKKTGECKPKKVKGLPLQKPVQTMKKSL